MARPIKETPILYGKEAEEFLKKMEKPIPIPKEDLDRGRQIYEALKAKGNFVY